MSSNLAIAITVGATVGGAIAGIKNLRSVVGLLKNDSISASKKLTVLGSGTAVAAAAAVNSIKAVSSQRPATFDPSLRTTNQPERKPNAEDACPAGKQCPGP